MSSKITHADVLEAQQAWSDGIVRISADYQSGGYEKAKATAAEFIKEIYTYQDEAVAFKPTLTEDPQAFRDTFEGALSYYVGGNSDYPNDKGFAILPWNSTDVKNSVIQINDRNSATSQGNVFFFDPEGKATTVDKSWGWEKYRDGSVRINLHHSALPNTNPVINNDLPDEITGQFERSNRRLGSWDVDDEIAGEDFNGLYKLTKSGKTLTLFSDNNDNGKIDSFDLAVGFAKINQAGGKLAEWEWGSSSDAGNVFDKSGDSLGKLMFLDEGIF